jgi:hypothetical protein
LLVVVLYFLFGLKFSNISFSLFTNFSDFLLLIEP